MPVCLPPWVKAAERSGYHAQTTLHLTTAPAQPQGFTHTVSTAAASVCRRRAQLALASTLPPCITLAMGFQELSLFCHCHTPLLTSTCPTGLQGNDARRSVERPFLARLGSASCVNLKLNPEPNPKPRRRAGRTRAT